jgi:hypothetical protein
MKAFLAGVKRWYRRRFQGIVEPPAHAKGQGTTWQQHATRVQGFTCHCGTVLAFSEADYKILSQNHIEGCDGIAMQQTGQPCACPVDEARYVKLCPQCRRGHWKQAK